MERKQQCLSGFCASGRQGVHAEIQIIFGTVCGSNSDCLVFAPVAGKVHAEIQIIFGTVCGSNSVCLVFAPVAGKVSMQRFRLFLVQCAEEFGSTHMYICI